MTTSLVDHPTLMAQCGAVREQHRAMRRAAPRIRLWTNKPDSTEGLLLRGEARDHVSGNFPFRKNQAAQGVLRLRLDHYLARWLISIPNDPNAKKNVVITVDHMGGAIRWSGLLKNWKIIRDASGVRYMDATFVDDLQFLQFMLGPPNPLLPIPIFQFPRVLPLFACPPALSGRGAGKEDLRTRKMVHFRHDPAPADPAEREPVYTTG